MKRFYPLLLSLALATVVHADEQTRNAQSALKDAGFYYGPITGEMNPDTAAAVRRYQIRNGLQVTGELNQETLGALLNGSSSGPENPVPQPQSRPEPARPVNPPPATARPMPQQEPAPTAEDRPYGAEPLIPFSKLFANTPYSRAPLAVQQETFKRAQDQLARKGFYRGPVNGMPSENVRRALAAYQDARGLRPTGQLDMDTLHQMRLLPGESASGFGTEPARPQRRIYRGIEVR